MGPPEGLPSVVVDEQEGSPTKEARQNPTELMFEAGVRCESVLWLPGLGFEAYAEPFKEFCEWLPERDDAPLYASLPGLMRYRECDDLDDDELVEAVGEHLTMQRGFLIQAATPVRRYGKSGGCTYSWGHYHTAWLYAPDEASIAPVCVAWADAMGVEDGAPSEPLVAPLEGVHDDAVSPSGGQTNTPSQAQP